MLLVYLAQLDCVNDISALNTPHTKNLLEGFAICADTIFNWKYLKVFYQIWICQVNLLQILNLFL